VEGTGVTARGVLRGLKRDVSLSGHIDPQYDPPEKTGIFR